MKKIVIFLLLLFMPISVFSESVSSVKNPQELKEMFDKICADGKCSAEAFDKMDDEEFLLTILQPMSKLKKAEQAYKAAKEKEQSLANRTLTAATTAAMGIGGMELAMGLSEQKADKDAEADMKAYLSTFRCKYTDGKSFKGGPDPIELPGGNDAKIMSYRNEYISLAKDLKERKEALGMKPGIESEEILDKADMGLYDDENVGITSGNYASLYRATALNSEEDQAKIQAEKDKSAKRVKGGAIAVGVGAGVGIIGNALINNDSFRTKIEGLLSKTDDNKEKNALDKLKQCLKSGNATKVDSLKFDKFKPSLLNLTDIECDGQEWQSAINKRSASYLFEDIDDAEIICYKLTYRFGEDIAKKLWGSSCGCTSGRWDDENNRCADNKALIEKYKTMGIDLTENDFNSASFELNGDCWTGLFSRTEKKVELDENNHCDGLTTKGTWVVWFDKVSMHGSAKCEYEHVANFEYSCSCKIDKIEKPYDMLVAKNTPWVKDFVVYTTQQECDALCTKRCSEHVGHLQNIREEMMVGF